MAGTRAGGLKAKAKILAENPDFYSEQGKIGGTKGTTGGFYNDPEKARAAGIKGSKTRWNKSEKE